MIPGGQLEEGLLRQLVAHQFGKILAARPAAKPILEPSEMVQGIEFEQRVRGGLGARTIASQPCQASPQLQGIEVAGVAVQGVLDARRGSLKAPLPEEGLGQFQTGGATPGRRKAAMLKASSVSAWRPRAALARPN